MLKLLAMKDLAIIIVSYNTKDLLDQCINSIYKHTRDIDFEIIIVDNNSSDGTKEMINKKYPNIYLIENKENIGYGNANNQGMKKADAKYLCLLNSDTYIHSNVFKKMYDFMQENKQVDVLGPKLLHQNAHAQRSVGKDYTLPIVFIMLFGGDKILRTAPKRTKKVDWIMGACFMLKSKVFENTKGFDPDFFMYVEEVEWCKRIRQSGFNIFHNPNFSLYHLERGSSGGKKTNAIVGIYKGIMLYYKKHYSKVGQRTAKFLLKLKAQISIIIGKLIKSDYLIETYTRALEVF